MKYTKSKDGIERATVHIPVRVTREEWAWLAKRVKKQNLGMSRHDLLRSMLVTGWEIEAEQAREEEDEEAEARERE